MLVNEERMSVIVGKLATVTKYKKRKKGIRCVMARMALR